MSLELTAQHQKAIDQLEQDHEQRLQEQLQKTMSDYEERMQQLVKEHEDALAGAQKVAQVTGGEVFVGAMWVCACKIKLWIEQREANSVVYYPTGTAGCSYSRKESH